MFPGYQKNERIKETEKDKHVKLREELRNLKIEMKHFTSPWPKPSAHSYRHAHTQK